MRFLFAFLLMGTCAWAEELSPAARGSILSLQQQRNEFADREVNAMAKNAMLQDEIARLKQDLEKARKSCKEPPNETR